MRKRRGEQQKSTDHLLDIMLQILVDGPCKSENLFLENKKSCKKSLSRNEELEYF